MNIVMLKKKLVAKKKQHKRKVQKVWPRDFVNQKRTLSDVIDAKLSQWHDDEYDSEKDW